MQKVEMRHIRRKCSAVAGSIGEAIFSSNGQDCG